jgi:hypothetical protein
VRYVRLMDNKGFFFFGLVTCRRTLCAGFSPACQVMFKIGNEEMNLIKCLSVASNTLRRMEQIENARREIYVVTTGL